MPQAQKGFCLAPEGNRTELLDAGDAIRVEVVEDSFLVVSVNGIPTASVRLAAADCLCTACAKGLVPLRTLQAGTECKGHREFNRYETYLMVGLSDPSAVTVSTFQQW